MSKRIEHDVRAKIRKNKDENKDENKRSVRKIAGDCKVSPTSVQLWLNRDSVFDQSRDPTVCPEMDIFEEIIFLEMLRLSRYHHGKLMRYLAPISTRLPSQLVPLSGRSKAATSSNPKQNTKKPITSSTVLRRIQRYASGALQAAYDENDAEPGKVAIHKIRFLWSSGDGKKQKGEAILLMERATGLLYASAYKRLRLNDIRICMSRLEQMYGNDILSMNFVMALDHRIDPDDVVSRSTVLHSPRSKSDCSLLADGAADELEDEIAFDFPLYAEDDTPYQARRALIPGTFKNIEAINRALSRLVNKINLTPRYYLHKQSRIELNPIKKLIIEYNPKQGKLVFISDWVKQIKLPRPWNYPIFRG